MALGPEHEAPHAADGGVLDVNLTLMTKGSTPRHP
jgi:hypothetical protein